MTYTEARTALLGHASALERRGYDDAPTIREAVDVLSNATMHITAELAFAVGTIARAHGGTLAVRYDSNDPENIWCVEVEAEDLKVYRYRVDDQTGIITDGTDARSV